MDSYVLNRVTGGTESQILGQLVSNGAVYLVNPNGILIGEEAQVQTAGFIASTLDLLGEDLLDKHFAEKARPASSTGERFTAMQAIFFSSRAMWKTAAH